MTLHIADLGVFVYVPLYYCSFSLYVLLILTTLAEFRTFNEQLEEEKHSLHEASVLKRFHGRYYHLRMITVRLDTMLSR